MFAAPRFLCDDAAGSGLERRFLSGEDQEDPGGDGLVGAADEKLHRTGVCRAVQGPGC